MLTRVQQFWDLPLEKRVEPTPFRWDLTVTYWDREWNMLWSEDEHTGLYVPLPADFPPVKPGDRLRVEGVFQGETEPRFTKVDVTRLEAVELRPQPLNNIRTESVQLRNRLVTVEALVDRQYMVGTTHLRLTFSAQGMSFTGVVLVSADQPVPQLTGAVVKLTGVCTPKLSEAFQLISLELLINSPANIEITGWLTEDKHFDLPVTPIEQLSKISPETVVRVVGRVKAQEGGRYLRLRDETGQVDVLSGQTLRFDLNEFVEAIGTPAISATQSHLDNGVFRALGKQPPVVEPVADAQHIRVAAQVLEMTPEEAAEAKPVTLTGVVTWSHPDAPFFFIRDASTGICVLRGTDPRRPRPAGRQVEIVGVTGMGSFAPVVVANASRSIADLPLPEARQITLEHALTGVEEGQWVSMRGFLRRITRDGEWSVLEVTTASGAFQAYLPASTDVTRMIGSIIRLHGVCAATANERRKLTGVRLWVPAAEFVQVEEAAPVDPFEVAARSLGSLGQFGSLQSLYRRVKVSGTVLRHEPGRSIYISDEGESLQVLARDTTPLQPGDRIDAVGFPGRQGGRVVLREAVFRKTGTRNAPIPQKITVTEGAHPDLDGRLVQLEGWVIDQGIARGARRLTLQSGEVTFEAYLDQTTPADAADWEDRSLLSLTGVYEFRTDEDGMAAGFQLLLRSPADVVVLQKPSWLTAGRVMIVSATLACGILLFIGWVAVLRRQVRAQTEQIRHQLKRESQLEGELQRATRLESLGLLAGGIAHDFNNLLTVVMGNLSLASLDEKLDAETAHCLREALKAVTRSKDLTQQLLTFAKGGSPVRAAVSLAEVVREVAGFALHGSKVGCEILIPPDIWNADVDKGQIGQVVQNIVINGREAMPDGGMIAIELRNDSVEEGRLPVGAGRYLCLTISDTGPGIPPEHLARIFEPYFTTKRQGSGLGLATVYSIVKKHHGHVAVTSQAGHGTTFTVWLPAASENALAASAPVPPAGRIPVLKGRVLFMDDEPEIRGLGQMILTRLGLEATAVADGAEVLQEYQNARHRGRGYDAVILDLTVPGGVGGRQTLEELLRLDPAVRAIVSSGYSNDQVLSNYRDHGFRGRVAKPYELGDVQRTLQAVLNGDVV